MAALGIKKMHYRQGVISLLLILATGVLVFRIAYIHIEKSAFLTQAGEQHYKRTIPIYAHRGNILDRHGHELAVSAPAVSIWAAPNDLLENENLDALAKLSKKIDLDFHELKRRIKKYEGQSFMYIKRQISPAVVQIVKESNLDMIGIINDSKRVYPESEVFGQIIGVTDIDHHGVEGVEFAFNEHLRGIDGSRSIIRDRVGRRLEVIGTLKEKVDGGRLVLSLDKNIQYTAFSELRRAVEYHQATTGMIVVLDVKKQKVLAIVNYPSFNPNERRSVNMSAMRNRVITDVFEPGSAMKPFVVAAALEAQAIQTNEPVDVAPGYTLIGNKKISDHKNYHTLNIGQILAKSSNVGMIKIASRMSDRFLENKLSRYGLFSSSGIELPAESNSLFASLPSWNAHYKSFLAFGYGAATSLLRLASSYMVLANQGKRYELSILDEHIASPGRQVMDQAVARQVLNMLEVAASEQGTGQQATTFAYRVAGKTGTAKKTKAGVYQDDAYIAVFCGIAPLTDPQIVVAVMIDEPKVNGFYGGQVAAPVFSRVASRILRYLDTTPDKPIPQFTAAKS